MEILLAHIFVAYDGWRMESRALKQHQLQFTLDGAALFRIGDNAYTARKNEMIVIRPGEIHSAQRFEQEPYSCVSVVFDVVPDEIPLAELVGARHHFSGLGPAMERDVRRLVALHQQPGPINRVECRGLLMKIAAELGRRHQNGGGHDDGEPSGSVSNRSKINLIKNYIMAHYRNDIRHDMLMQISGYSRNHIISQFGKTIGMTPMQYITWLRLQKAMELAVQTDLTFSEIAHYVGYPDVHTLGKMFKKKMGCSLTEYCSTIFTGRVRTDERN